MAVIKAINLVDACLSNAKEVPQIIGSDCENNKLDIFRNFVSQTVSQFSGKPAEEVYPLLEAPKNSEHGDIAVAVPRLRVKGDPAQYAQDWANQVEKTR